MLATEKVPISWALTCSLDDGWRRPQSCVGGGHLQASRRRSRTHVQLHHQPHDGLCHRWYRYRSQLTRCYGGLDVDQSIDGTDLGHCVWCVVFSRDDLSQQPSPLHVAATGPFWMTRDDDCRGLRRVANHKSEGKGATTRIFTTAFALAPMVVPGNQDSMRV